MMRYICQEICGSGSVVEHFLAKEDVAGSSPVSRSKVSGQRAVNRQFLCGQVHIYATHTRHRSQRFAACKIARTTSSVVGWSMGGVIASLYFPLSFFSQNDGVALDRPRSIMSVIASYLLKRVRDRTKTCWRECEGLC